MILVARFKQFQRYRIENDVRVHLHDCEYRNNVGKKYITFAVQKRNIILPHRADSSSHKKCEIYCVNHDVITMLLF